MSEKTLLWIILVVVVAPTVLAVGTWAFLWAIRVVAAMGMEIHNAVRRSQGWGE